MKQTLMLAALLLAALGQSAGADTRSDVQAAFNRCNAFADDRTWLNCIYGAAQPMRGKLGLPPAPASQTNLVPGPSLMPQVTSPPASQPPALAPQTARQGDSSDGFLAFLVGGQAVVTGMPVKAYSVGHDGLFTITLANGQVWREVDGGPVAHWHKDAMLYKASIVKGSLNSYNLTIAGEGIEYKVLPAR